MPFHWACFNQTTRYTYLIDLRLEIDEICQNLQHNVRTNLKKAEKNTMISTCSDSKIIYETLNFSFSQKKIKTPFSYEKLDKLHHKLVENKSVFAYSAADEKKEITAICYIILDKKTAYFLLSGKKTEKNNAAMSLLVWKSIQKAKELGCHSFDFDGSVLESVEPFFRSFGGERKAYFQIFKAKNKFLDFLFTLIK